MNVRCASGLIAGFLACLFPAACQGLPEGEPEEKKIEQETPIERRGPDGERKAQKPDWWPKAGGAKWPPPKPKGWRGPWPPGPPQGDDPGWWAKYYRGKDKRPGKDNPPKKDGSLGSVAFAQGFDPLRSNIMPRKDDCGIFFLHRVELRRVQSCKPYPSALIGQLCDLVVDRTAAETECRRECAQRPRTKCPQHRLYTPEAAIDWSCDPAVRVGGVVLRSSAVCSADYLCECWSN